MVWIRVICYTNQNQMEWLGSLLFDTTNDVNRVNVVL